MTFPWRTVRIFISSTFRDMQAERDWLVRFVFPRLREELLPRRIHLVDVDLRWGVTSEQDALGVCREVIDECWPRFMGVLGGRYGWVPPGRTESITADEIHYGVLAREAGKRGQAFFYFRDPQATADIVEETPGDFREPDGSEAGAKLAALKQAITAAGLPVFTYPAKWDAAQQRLTGLEAFGNQVHTDLLQSLKDDPELAARFTGEGDAETDPFARECAEESEQMEAFIEERTDRFVLGSREPLMRDMLAFATSEGTPNIFVLTGDPGSGKSAFLAKFVRSSAVRSSAFRRFPSPPKGGTPSTPLLITHFTGASTGSTDLRRTLRRLCHDIARAAGNTEPLPLDIKDLIPHFQKLLAEAADRRRVILVFDALNQFDATDGAHWLNWLPRELPPGVRIVASVIAPADGQPEHQTLAILRARPGTRMEKLEPLTEADTLAVIEGRLRRYAKRLSPEQLAALLAKPAGRLPLYVLTALEELRTLGTYEEITDRIRTLPGDARALFGWILTERLARDPGFRDREGRPCGAALVEKFAACLGVSRHGLSPAELAALLEPGDPLGNVAALLRLLRPYLMRRGELLDFYHGQFREAAEDAFLKTEAQRQAAHLQLADYFEARETDVRRIEELPWQLCEARSWRRLYDLLRNLPFFTAAWQIDRYDVQIYWTQTEAASHLRILDAYREVLEVPSLHAKCVWDVAALFEYRGYPIEAAHLWEFLLEKARRDRDVADLSTCLGNLALNYGQRGDFRQAVELHAEAANLCRQRGDETGFAKHLGDQAIILTTQGAFEQAMVLLKQQENVCRMSNDREGVAVSLGRQAVILHQRGEMLGARTLLQEQENLCRELGLNDLLAYSLGRQAVICAAEGDFDTALAIHCDEERICRQFGITDGLINSLGNQGRIRKHLGQLDDAILLFKTTENLCRSLGNKQALAVSLSNQGLIHKGREDFDTAMGLQSEAGEIYRQLGDMNGLAFCLGNEANLYDMLGDCERALTLHREQERICREIGAVEGIVISMANQGNLLARSMEKPKEAIAVLLDALKLAKEHRFLIFVKQIETNIEFATEQLEATPMSYTCAKCDKPINVIFPKEGTTVNRLIDSGLYCAKCDEIVCLGCGAAKMSGGGSVPCGICGGPARAIEDNYHPTWFPGERPNRQANVVRRTENQIGLQVFLAKPGGQEEGPFSVDQINRDLATRNYIEEGFWAWYEGLDKWIPVYQLPGIKISTGNTSASPIANTQHRASPDASRRAVSCRLIAMTETQVDSVFNGLRAQGTQNPTLEEIAGVLLAIHAREPSHVTLLSNGGAALTAAGVQFIANLYVWSVDGGLEITKGSTPSVDDARSLGKISGSSYAAGVASLVGR